MVEIPVEMWLKADEIADKGDVTVVFIDEGEIKKAETTGFKDDVFEIGIEIDLGGKVEKRRWTMNTTSMKAVATMYGRDSAAWVGKKAIIYVEDVMVGGKKRKAIFARTEVEEKVE